MCVPYKTSLLPSSKGLSSGFLNVGCCWFLPYGVFSGNPERVYDLGNTVEMRFNSLRFRRLDLDGKVFPNDIETFGARMGADPCFLQLLINKIHSIKQQNLLHKC